jgi:hypothetical protein
VLIENFLVITIMLPPSHPDEGRDPLWPWVPAFAGMVGQMAGHTNF